MPEVLIIGAGQIGLAVADGYLNAGWDVTLIRRSHSTDDSQVLGRGAKIVRLDRNDDSALSALAQSGADLLVDTIAYTNEHAKQLLALEQHFGSFAVISSASVYRDDQGRTLDEAKAPSELPVFPVPIAETQRTVEASDQTYSTRKIAIEQTLLQNSSIPVIVLRPCAIYGKRSRAPREWWFVKRVLDGRKRVPLAYRGRSQFHTSSTANIAETIRIAHQARYHGPLNAADPQAPTVADIAETVARAFDHEWDLVPLEDRLSDDRLEGTEVGHTPWSLPFPLIVDTAKAQSLGYQPITSYQQAAPDYSKWLAEVGANGNLA